MSEPESPSGMGEAVEDDPHGWRDQCCGLLARLAVARPEKILFLLKLPLQVCDLLLRSVVRPPGRFVSVGSDV